VFSAPPTWTPEDLATFEARHPYPYKAPVAQLPGVSRHTPAQAEAYAHAYATYVANPSAYHDDSDTSTYAAIFAEDYLHTTLIPDHLPSYLEEWACLQQKANTEGLTAAEEEYLINLGWSLGLLFPGFDRLMAPSDRDGGGHRKSQDAEAAPIPAAATVRVGRWMSEVEYRKMVDTGMVQESLTGTTHVAYPAKASAFYNQARPGSMYVEFDVPATSVVPTQEGWAKILGPNSLQGRNAARRGRPVPQLPPAGNIVHLETKP
jgi:hypothetical protein